MQILDQQQEGRKFELQMKEGFGIPGDRTNTSNVDEPNNCINIPDYFRSSADKEANNRAGRLLMVKIHNDFNNIFTGVSIFFESTFNLQMR